MKILIFCIVFFFLMSCQKDTKALLNSEQNKNVFNYSDFLKQTPSKIAQELSEILGVSISSTLTEVTPQDWPVGLASHPWVEKGYKFETNNGASIVIWVDQNENKIYVTYLLRRYSVSDSNSFGLDKADSTFKKLLPQIGIEFDGTEIYSCFESQVTVFQPPRKIYYYYKVKLYQTYSETKIKNPYLEADIEGSTGEINYLKFGKWYYNINHPKNRLEDEELLKEARILYQDQEDILSIPEHLSLYGFHFINDRLCQKVGSAIIGADSSFRDLYLDIFTADLLCTENIYVN